MSGKVNRYQRFGNVVGEKEFNPEAVIDAMFHRLLAVCFKPGTGEPEVYVRLQKKHAMGVFRRRRKEALLRLLPVVKEKCYPSSEKKIEDSLAAMFLTNEFMTGFDYNVYDAYGDFRLGAIIWILDNLKRAGNLEKAVEHLPFFGNIGDTPLLPKNFFHPCYSKSLIESMMYVMTMRFESSQVKTVDPGLASDNILLEANAEGRQYNAAFQCVMDLLPQEAVAQACDEFRNMVLGTVRMYLKGDYALQARYAAYANYLREAEKTARKMIDTKAARYVGPVASPSTGFSLKNFGLIAPTDGLSGPVCLAGRDNVFGDNLTDECTNITNYLDRLDKAMDEYPERFTRFFFKDRQQLHDFFDDREVEDMFLNYKVSDPMAMCFALIYLVDHGDDTPWLFRSGGCVMNEVLFTLPWGAGKKEDLDDDSRINSVRFKSVDFTPEGWLDKKFGSVDCYSRKDGDMNLAQLFYRMTGCVLPTGIPDPFDAHKGLSGWGLSPFAHGFVSGAAYSLYLSSQQTRMPEESGSVSGEESEEDTNAAGSKDTRKEAAIADLNSKVSVLSRSREDLQAELLQARREIKCLKRAAAEDRKHYAAEMLQKDEELRKARLEHRELVDLREMMFSGLNRRHGSGSSREVAAGLPYETTKRVVIFGGHASFLKQMKDYLPSVRFVDVDNIAFNPDIVRNSDVVWIQNNCISHSQYWNVVKVARQYGVQVRYFSYSSAEKSAVQVMEDDVSSGL